MSEIVIKLIIVIIGSGIGLFIMDRIHKKKVREAEDRFKWMMKSYGMEDEVNDGKK